MKPRELEGPDKVYERTITKFGSSSERLRILVFPAKEVWIAIILGCGQSCEKLAPDISSLSFEDAKFKGLHAAIYLLHESDQSRACKIGQCHGQLISTLRELAEEKWNEVTRTR